MGTLLQLSLAYALPLALTALLFVKQWQTRRLLAILLVVLPCFYVLHFVGLRALTGWPSDAAPPDEFELIYEQGEILHIHRSHQGFRAHVIF